MKKLSFNYTEKGTKNRWIMSIDGQEVQIFCDGELRKYTIPEEIESIEQKNEYIFINVQYGFFYQFKFEESKFLVADIYDENGFIKTFGCHVFGE